MYIKSNIHESKLVFIHYTNSFSKKNAALLKAGCDVCEEEGLAWSWGEGKGLACHHLEEQSLH